MPVDFSDAKLRKMVNINLIQIETTDCSDRYASTIDFIMSNRQKEISLITECLTEGIQLGSGLFSSLFSLTILPIKAKIDHSGSYKGQTQLIL